MRKKILYHHKDPFGETHPHGVHACDRPTTQQHCAKLPVREQFVASVPKVQTSKPVVFRSSNPLGPVFVNEMVMVVSEDGEAFTVAATGPCQYMSATMHPLAER
eukprot:m.1108693 g.1108693  ORF g.1108693 m.1108693 type:complete len:104 (-) comp24352_c0_seq19:1531-1842(-)